MSLPPLTVIPAGAGSGKTYAIQQRLGDWVAQGLVRPERIVAVTFTEAAAGELRERIRAQLTGAGRLEDAMRLDEAYISTLHGFGQRLLTEFAFENGSSPVPRLLNDDEKSVLVRQALAGTDKVAGIIRDLGAHGYRYAHAKERPAEDAFREDILRLVGLLRAMGWVAADPACAAQAATWIAAAYGPTLDGAALTRRLQAAVDALLASFPESLAENVTGNKSATRDLHRDYANLIAARTSGRLDGDWKLWAELAKLRTGNGRAKLPPGYDALAQAVIDAASELPLHAGPLAGAQARITALIDAAQDVLVHYASTKRALGLVDYEDMIALAHALLAGGSGALGTLRARIDCLVVDEFQDTNPLQFALLWQLHRAGVPTLVVGDLKQAIMGFQGADARLFAAIIDANADKLHPLRSNWRSQPAIMDFVNAAGARLFPDAYVPLRAEAPATTLAPLEAIEFTSLSRGNHAGRAAAVGERLAELLADDSLQVIDRHTKRARRLRASDIAVLCPTHDMLADYAAVLRAQGLQVQLEEPGWLGSRAVQLALAALAYVANPADRHAALYLETTELGARTLTDALAVLMDGGVLDSPLLERLRVLATQADEPTVYTLVSSTLDVLGLFDEVQHWPGARQQRANLLRLLAEAGEFMDAKPEALACGGFHGSGLPTFLAWLNAKIERVARADTQPPPSVLDEHAVELVTWHSAKGREWPVVVVGGLDREINVDLPKVELGYRRFDDLGRLLQEAELHYSPAFHSTVTADRFKAPLMDAALAEARRLIYVALTRAREKLVVEWPVYKAASSTTTHWQILAGDCRLALADDAFEIDGARFPCRVRRLLHEPEVPGSPASAPPAALVTHGRRALRPGVLPATTPDVVTASMSKAEGARAFRGFAARHAYAAPLATPAGRGGTGFGTALHRCFEVLGANPATAGWLPAILAVDANDAFAAAVAAQVIAFEAWLAQTWPGASIHREWPVLAARADGSVLSGTIDLLLIRGEDAWVIDHKSDQVADNAEGARQYLGQLETYAAALAARGLRVRGLGLHWIRQGVVEFVRWDAPP